MDVNRFVLNRDVRLTWIAFFTQWALWGTVYFVRHIFEDNPAVASATNQQMESKHTARKWKLTKVHGSRLNHVHRVLSENTLLLLGVLILNTFGGGSTRAVMVLTWIFFSLSTVAALTEIGCGHRFVRFLYSIALFGIALSIGGLSFKQGWRD